MRSRRTSLISWIVAAAFVGAVGAQTVRAEVSECVGYDDPKRLMACYSKLMVDQVDAATGAKKPRVGPYIHVKSQDDSESGWTLTASDMGAAGWRSLSLRTYARNLWVRSEDQADAQRFEDLRPSIWLRCIDGQLSGFMDWGVFLDIERARITFRFDDEPVRAATTNVSADRQRIEPLGREQLIQRIRAMSNRQTLVAQVTPPGERPLAVEFDISGLVQAIQPLREACPW